MSKKKQKRWEMSHILNLCRNDSAKPTSGSSTSASSSIAFDGRSASVISLDNGTVLYLREVSSSSDHERDHH